MEVKSFKGNHLVDLSEEVSEYLGCNPSFIYDSFKEAVYLNKSGEPISKYFERYHQRVAKVTLLPN